RGWKRATGAGEGALVATDAIAQPGPPARISTASQERTEVEVVPGPSRRRLRSRVDDQHHVVVAGVLHEALVDEAPAVGGDPCPRRGPVGVRLQDEALERLDHRGRRIDESTQ